MENIKNIESDIKNKNKGDEDPILKELQDINSKLKTLLEQWDRDIMTKKEFQYFMSNY